MLTIESAQNDTFKKLQSLTTSKGLKKEGLFLLSGENLIREFLNEPKLKIHYELITAKMKPLLSAASDGTKTVQLAPDLFAALDSVGTGFNVLVLEQPTIAALDSAAIHTYAPQGIELVIPTGDPGNLGALIRSAEAFGVRRAILTEEAAHPFLPKSVKASAGSVLRLPVSRGPALREFPENCIALDMCGVVIDDFVWPQNGLLVVGEEGNGLGEAKFKQCIRIPTEGVESLNAVVAASIALALRQRAGQGRSKGSPAKSG
jgi:TrmH family RNA methyltransferase